MTKDNADTTSKYTPLEIMFLAAAFSFMQMPTLLMWQHGIWPILTVWGVTVLTVSVGYLLSQDQGSEQVRLPYPLSPEERVAWEKILREKMIMTIELGLTCIPILVILVISAVIWSNAIPIDGRLSGVFTVIAIIAALLLGGGGLYLTMRLAKNEGNLTFKPVVMYLGVLAVGAASLASAATVVPPGKLVFIDGKTTYTQALALYAPWEHQQQSQNVALEGILRGKAGDSTSKWVGELNYFISNPSELSDADWASYLALEEGDYFSPELPELGGISDPAETLQREFLESYPFLEANVTVTRTETWTTAPE